LRAWPCTLLQSGAIGTFEAIRTTRHCCEHKHLEPGGVLKKRPTAYPYEALGGREGWREATRRRVRGPGAVLPDGELYPPDALVLLAGAHRRVMLVNGDHCFV
jgi:hypothetical protein